MTLIRLPAAHSGAETVLAQAEAHYLEVLAELEAVKMYFRDRDDLAETEIKRVLAEYRRVTTIVYEERRRVQNVAKQELGIVHDYALHFDRIRDEIGGRLDRLRASVAAGPAA